jgi:HrpA-like RNA helicase
MRTRVLRQMLIRLGALTEEEETITSLGRHLAAFPIAPRFAKMLVLGHQVGLAPARPAVYARLTSPSAALQPLKCAGDGTTYGQRATCRSTRVSACWFA